MSLRWRRQLGRQDERAQFRLGAPDSEGVRLQATANIPLVPQQTVGGMAFEIVLDLLDRVELRGIGGELLHMQPGMGLLHRLDRWSQVHRATVPQWESHALGPLSARAAAGARVAGRSICAAPQAQAWGRAPLRRRQPGRKRGATEVATVALVCSCLRHCSLYSPHCGPIRERFCLRCSARTCELIHALGADEPDPVRLSSHIHSMDVVF